MKVGVTSVTGQLGKAIANALKSQGNCEVRGIARTPANAVDLGIEVRKGDYKSKDEFLSALKGLDALVLISGNDDPEKRKGQHANVIDAAKEVGVKKVVYTSILGRRGIQLFTHCKQ